MRIQQAVQQIKDNPYYQKYYEICNISKEEYDRRYSFKIKLHYGYYKALWNHIMNTLYNYIPYFQHKEEITIEGYKFTFVISVRVYEHSREAKIIQKSYVYSNDAYLLINKLDLNFDRILPDKFDLSNNIKKQLIDFYKKDLYFEGVFAKLQMHYQCDKEQVRWRYKAYINQEKELFSFDYLSTLKKIKKRYNVSTELPIYEFDKVVNWINKNGKQNNPVELALFDWRTVYDRCDETDGDIDEIENVFWETIDEIEEPNKIYIN